MCVRLTLMHAWSGLVEFMELTTETERGRNVAARYAHMDSDPLRRATNAIGASIAAAMGDNPAGAKVIDLRKT